MATATASAGLALPSLGLVVHDGGRVTEAGLYNAGANGSSSGNGAATDRPPHSGRGSPSSPRSPKSRPRSTSGERRSHSPGRSLQKWRTRGSRGHGSRVSRPGREVEQHLGIHHSGRLFSVQTDETFGLAEEEKRGRGELSEYDMQVHMAAEDMQNRLEAACQAMQPYLARLKSGQLIVEVGSRCGDVALMLSQKFQDLVILPTEGTGNTSPALFLLLQERLAANDVDIDAHNSRSKPRATLAASTFKRASTPARLGRILPPRFLDGGNLQSWKQKLASQDVNCICTVNVLQYLSADSLAHFLQGSRDTLVHGGTLLIAGPFIDGGEASDNLLVYDGTLQNFANSPARRLEDTRGEMKWGCHDTKLILALAAQVGLEFVAQREIRGVGGMMWLLIVLRKRLRNLGPSSRKTRRMSHLPGL